MDGKQFHSRIRVVLLLLAVLLFLFVGVLYNLQYVHGADYLEQSVRKIAETQKVEAARGQILDRYGRVLVDNRTTYQVTLNTNSMGDVQQRNQTILSLIQLCRKAGVTWVDTLPISKQAPYVYTLESATPTQRGYLQSLMNVMGWKDGQVTVLVERLKNQAAVSASTQQTVEEKSALEQALEESVGGYLLDEVQTWYDLDGMVGDNEDVPLSASAESLLAQMRKSYEVDESVSDEDARALVGVLYELSLRSRDVNRASGYVFAQDVDMDFIAAVKEHGLTGVEIEPVSTRAYNTTYAAHLLGHVGKIDPDEWYGTEDTPGYNTKEGYSMNDTVGKDGVELAFESYLKGSAGEKTIERNTEGKVVNEIWTTEPEPGSNVVLTLDLRLQEALENSLAQRVPGLTDKVEGAAGVIVNMEGEVLAMASYPTYDLSTIYQDTAAYQAASSDPLTPFVNRATNGLYSPGSTFKMITGVAALQEGLTTPSEKILDTGTFQYPSGEHYPYGDYHPSCWYWLQYRGRHGYEDIAHAIMDSCNIYFFTMGDRLGISKLEEYAAMFGLGQPTGIELPEKTGYVAGKQTSEDLGQTWYDGLLLSAAIGQGNTLCTPLQLANYIATLVNGGTHYSAHLLKAVKSSDYTQVLEETQPEALDTIDISQENLEAVKQGMYLLATEGSVAKYFADLPVTVGAKTGTAQVGSANTEANAVFVCFAPYEDPEIAIALVAEHGGSGTELAAIAADIISAYFSASDTMETASTENTLIR